MRSPNEDEQAWIDILRKALEASIRQITENTRVEGSVVVNTVLSRNERGYGFQE